MKFSMPGFPVLHYLPEFAQTHVHWVSDAIQPSHPQSPPSPLALNLSQHQGLFQWVGSLHQVAKALSSNLSQHQGLFQWVGFLHQVAKALMSFLISPSNEYLGLISCRMDWFDLLAVQGTLKRLLQHQWLKVCFHHLVIVSNAAVNIGVQVFEFQFSVLFMYI